MNAYLVDHAPRRSQFRKTRRARPTGTIVVHSAENLPDVRPPDTGAEDVSGFIRRRSDPGSYHVLCDSDSRVQLVPFAWEAFHDGTGSNPWSIGISGAFQAHQWRTLPKWWRDACVMQMAAAAREAADWLHSCYGIEVPAIRLTKGTYNQPGFCSHAEREQWFGDPGRRSDPGPWFPWDEFLFLFAFAGASPPEEDMTDREFVKTQFGAWLRRLPNDETEMANHLAYIAMHGREAAIDNIATSREAKSKAQT